MIIVPWFGRRMYIYKIEAVTFRSEKSATSFQIVQRVNTHTHIHTHTYETVQIKIDSKYGKILIISESRQRLQGCLLYFSSNFSTDLNLFKFKAVKKPLSLQ